VLGALYLIWAQVAHSHTVLTWIPLLIAALALVAVVPLNRVGKEKGAFACTAITIAMATVQLFWGLFPYVMPASNDVTLSLTVANASSSQHTLEVMSIATLILLPLVLAYQAWSYWVFRHRVGDEDTPMPGAGLVDKAKRGFKSAFDQQ
jgi:cytochrome d ubiquinol oxidase subunit II